MKVSNPVSKRLKEARISYGGISQKKLGIAIGVDEFSASARINQYETGKHVPDFQTLKRLGSFLGCPTAYFYAEDDELAGMILAFYSATKTAKREVLKLLQV